MLNRKIMLEIIDQSFFFWEIIFDFEPSGDTFFPITLKCSNFFVQQ
jgi:hypothetical protein